MRLSIIIANWNYQDFVGEAIASALAVDWADKEVIVVDDASTDGSRAVIEGFTGEITAYFRPKSHQLGAHIFGFEQSTGDVIIFLDADDLLEPAVMQEVAKVWGPKVSKVQYRMNVIDAAGAQLGTGFPQFPAKSDPATLRRVFLSRMAYTTPPGTGNAYSREFVLQAFAIAPPALPASDTVLVTLAPLLGDVMTIRKPLARYRVHGANYAALEALDADKFRRRLQEDIETARLFASATQRLGLRVPADPLRRCPNHLQYRLASYLVDRAAHPFPKDSLPSLLCRLAHSGIGYSEMRLRDRAILLAWGVACALSPRRYRRKLVLWRFAPTSRPAAVRTLLGALSSLRSSRLPGRASAQ